MNKIARGVKRGGVQRRQRQRLPLPVRGAMTILAAVFHRRTRRHGNMRKRAGLTPFFGILALTAIAAGCGSQDAEGLSRVCSKASQRGEDVTGGRQSKLATSWQALRASAGTSAIDCRVAIRL